MKKYLPMAFATPLSPAKAILSTKNSVAYWLDKTVAGICAFLLFFLLLAGNNKLLAQAQIIGSFPEMQGGIENQALGFLPVGAVNYAAGANVTTYSRNNNTSSVTVEIKSTGGYGSPKAIDWANTSTSSTIFTPTAATDAVLSNTSYVVQFFARMNTSTTSRPFNVRVYTNGGNYSEVLTTQLATSVYQKFTAIVTTPVDAATGKTGYVGIKPKNGSFGGLTYLIDDFCMYAGSAVDVTAPDNATAPVITSFAPTSLGVSWTAPGTGVDGGGYVVVRYTADPTGQPDPTNNGIYAVGNTIGTGTVAYIGTGTSFTNTGLTPATTYYYRVYVADKAFNYSLTPPVVIGYTGQASPTLVTFTTPPGCATDRIILTWTGPLNYNGTNNTILAFLKQGSAVTAGTPTFLPSAYNASTDFSAPIAPNYQNDVNARCIYRGDGTNAAGDHSGLTITGLAPNTTYHVLMYNVTDVGPAYSPSVAANGTTLATPVAEPTNNPSVFIKGVLTTSNIPVNWAPAAAGAQAPLGYLLQADSIATPNDGTDATDPANQTNIFGGSANVKIPYGTNTYSAFTGFTAGTMYYFRANSYTNTGSCINYKAAGPVLNAATLPNAVSSPSMAISGTTGTITWTAAPGYDATRHTTLVFVKASLTAITVGTPTNNPSTYSDITVSPFGTAYQLDAAAGCVYKGDGTTVTITGLSSGVTYQILVLTVVDAVNSDASGLSNSYSAYATTTATTGSVYYWNGLVSNRWDRAANWTPTRTTPATTDILIVNLGGTFLIDSVVTETIAQLQIINNTNVTIRSRIPAKTLTITSNNGPLNADLIVAAGSTLTHGIVPGGLVTITLGINTTTADISGFMQVPAGGTYNTDAANALTTVTGTLRNSGTVSSTSVARVLVTSTGTYEHTHSGGGVIPTATWQSGSTCLISGVTVATAFTGSGHGQAFSNFVWNCPLQTSTFVLGSALAALPWAGTFAENFIIKTTGSGTLAITSPASSGNIQRNFTVGNFYQRSGTVAIALGTNNLNVQRSLTVNGIFSVKDSSIGAASFQILNTPVAATQARLFVNGDVDMVPPVSSVALASITPGASTAEIWFGGSSAQTARFQTITGNIDFNNNHTGTGVTLLSNATANRFLLTQGRFFINGNTLTINNAISYPGAGTGAFGGSSTSNLIMGLSGAAGELRFTPGFRTLKDFTQLGGNSASLGTELAITAGASAGRDSLGIGASLETNDNLILRSDEFGTARIARIPADPTTGAALATITEKVTVERHLPMLTAASARRWRLLTAPFTATNSPTINAAWQGGVSNPDRTNPSAFDPRPGYGTHITRSATWAADGYDHGSTNNPSIYFYSKTTPGFWRVPATTNGIKITDSSGCFMLFARGDRSIVVSSPYIAAVPTTLEPKGELRLGRVTIAAATAGDYQTIGNPYASQIKLDNVTFNGTTGINKTVYIWDPKTDGTANVGKFITCSGNGSTYLYTANTSVLESKPGVIESSGAFMAQSTGGNIVFNESDKTIESTTIGIASRPARQPGPLGKINTLYADLMAVKTNGPVLADGIVVSFNKNYKNGIDNLDAPKLSMFNTKEDLGIRSGGQLLSIERRKEVTIEDTIHLNISKLYTAAYQFVFRPVDFDITHSAFIEDAYLKTSTPIDLAGGSSFDFNITGDSASFAANRFQIVFKRMITEIPVPSRAAFTVFPNPVQNGLVNLQMGNMAAGEYNFKLLNSLGQAIQTGRILHQTETATEQIRINKSIAKGNYKLQVATPEKNISVTSVIIQ